MLKTGEKAKIREALYPLSDLLYDRALNPSRHPDLLLFLPIYEEIL